MWRLCRWGFGAAAAGRGNCSRRSSGGHREQQQHACRRESARDLHRTRVHRPARRAEQQRHAVQLHTEVCGTSCLSGCYYSAAVLMSLRLLLQCSCTDVSQAVITVQLYWDVMSWLCRECDLVKDGVSSMPEEQDLMREEASKMSSVLPTMWLGAQNGWWVSGKVFPPITCKCGK